MESVLAIGVGLVLRVVVDVATDNDDRVGGVLVGLWEGVVLNHFVRKMPRSFDPYIGLGFRIFVDFLFTQSLSRLALVALWTVVGMLLADVAPSVWYDSGLRRIYRRIRKDVRHMKRAVPDIRIKNDIPSVRFFTPKRATSTAVAGSIRSDRAAIARSPAPSPTPPRIQKHSPPGTFPDASGWSETDVEVTARERVVVNPGPSPSFIPSREGVVFGSRDTTHVRTPRAQTAHLPETTITMAQTQNETVLLETVVDAAAFGATTSTLIDPIDDASRHNLPQIPDDWVNVTPQRSRSNTPVHVFEPLPLHEPQPDPSTFTRDSQPRPTSIVFPTPAINALPDITDIDLGEGDRSSRVPHEIPLPGSRAVSDIGGVYDQPRAAWRENVFSHVDKANSDLGIDPSRPYAPFMATHTKGASGSHIRTASSDWAGSKLKHLVAGDAPEVPPKTDTTKVEPVVGGEAEPASGTPHGDGAARESEPQMPTPAQVDAPPSVLNQPTDPGATSAAAAADTKHPPQTTTQLETTPVDSANVDASPVPPQTGVDSGACSGDPLVDAGTSCRAPPPPFTEIPGVGEVTVSGEGPKHEDPVTQDQQPTELTKEQRAAEAKRQAFLMTQIKELEGERNRLQGNLDPKNKPSGKAAADIKSNLAETEKSLSAVKARISKVIFSEPPTNFLIPDVNVTGKSSEEVGLMIASEILDMLLARDDAGPMTIQVLIKGKPTTKKSKDAKEAVLAFVTRNQFSSQFKSAEPATQNSINTITITF
ncbi:hypothetical protein BDN67DRAFT_255390 [Paxillus ammoniavirescens]|nr:hypothetical protein BDN67DRAFT_255390 [Paxillus ammoniavirescens]